jgi:hypothetical protein
MRKEQRNGLIISIWLRRSSEERTPNHVPAFYKWLLGNRPDLLPVTRKGKDPYQKLQSILSRHFIR